MTPKSKKSDEGEARPSIQRDESIIEDEYESLLSAYRAVQPSGSLRALRQPQATSSSQSLNKGQQGPSEIVHAGSKMAPIEHDVSEEYDECEYDENLNSAVEFEERENPYGPGSKWIIPHNSSLRVRWDIAQAFVLVYLAIVVPLRIGFNLEVHGPAYVIECLVELYFYLDIVINFVTSYEDENLNVIRDHKLLAQKYLRGWFLVDLISVLPVDLTIRITSGLYPCSFYVDGCDEDPTAAGQYVKIVKLVRLIRLVKLLRLMRLGRLMAKYQDDMFNLLRMMAYVKLIVFMIYLGHIFGCMFYFFSDEDWLTDYEKERTRNGTMETWLDTNFVETLETTDPGTGLVIKTEKTNLEDTPLTVRYIAAAYWAFTTMTTVGYGDISAGSVAERTFAILGMIVGGLMLSTIASNIIVLFDEAHMHEKVMKQKMLQVEQWAKDLKLGKPTRVRLLTFFRRQHENPYDQAQLLMQLPFEMRCLIIKNMYADLISKVPFIKDVDNIFRTELCVGLKPLTLMPARYVYLQGERGLDMYLIQSGVVNVIDWMTNQRVGQLSRGAYFGEGGLVGDFRRRETVRSHTMAHLLALPVERMTKLLEHYPEVKMKMTALYEKRIYLYNKYHPITYNYKYLYLTHDNNGEVMSIKYAAPQNSLANVCPNVEVSYFDKYPDRRPPDFQIKNRAARNDSSASLGASRAAEAHAELLQRTEQLEASVASLSEKMDAVLSLLQAKP